MLVLKFIIKFKSLTILKLIVENFNVKSTAEICDYNKQETVWSVCSGRVEYTTAIIIKERISFPPYTLLHDNTM